MGIRQEMLEVGQKARSASGFLRCASSNQKDKALLAIAKALRSDKLNLLEANAKDLDLAERAGLDAALLDRLTLKPETIATMAEGLKQIKDLPDPVGEMDGFSYRPSGIQVGKMRVPLGVVCMIYEARPNVTADAAGLCLKSGNAVILRGGSEAFHSNQAIAACVHRGLAAAGLPEDCVQVITTIGRAAVGELITMTEYIDVVIPRGGKGLIERISREARVPVIKHLDGNCHVFIDEGADKAKALAIAFNAKTQRYGTCNTIETLLVHANSVDILSELAQLYWNKGVELRGCLATRELLGEQVVAATEADWDAEYLAPILAVKVVTDLGEAIAHINQHGSHHTDAIVTENYSRARRFLAEVDSSSVMVNASTRFADGFEYGLGAEIGISTDKIHARGPVGLEGLTSQKWVVLGEGQVRG